MNNKWKNGFFKKNFIIGYEHGNGSTRKNWEIKQKDDGR